MKTLSSSKARTRKHNLVRMGTFCIILAIVFQVAVFGSAMLNLLAKTTASDEHNDSMEQAYHLLGIDHHSKKKGNSNEAVKQRLEKQDHQSQQIQSSSPFTYAFILGGVDPAVPRYRGMLYSIFVAVFALQSHGSSADVIMFVQPTAERVVNADTSSAAAEHYLTSNEIRVARELGIHLRYLPAPEASNETFHGITMNKFIILSLTEYQKVVFMDADLLILNNFDYLFEASFLRPNFYLATSGEPANAGLFLLTPEPGDYENAQEIMRKQKESAQNITGKVKFDIVKGWGHVIMPPDQWETTRRKGVGTNWTFYCAPSDQGFLYYWTKYHKKDVSIMVRNGLKNWQQNVDDNAVQLAEVLNDPFHVLSNKYTNWTLKQKWDGCELKRRGAWGCMSPHRDYIHLAGEMKPWRKPVPEGGVFGPNSHADAFNYWFYLLGGVNDKYSLGINFSNWDAERQLFDKPPLGWKPEYYPKKCTGCSFT